MKQKCYSIFNIMFVFVFILILLGAILANQTISFTNSLYELMQTPVCPFKNNLQKSTKKSAVVEFITADSFFTGLEHF